MKKHLVLLHGWGFSHKIWHHLTPLLEKNYIVHTLDLQGFGVHNEVSTTITFSSLIDQVLQDAPQEAAYLGWSLGGLVAMGIAIHHPNRISDLITFASTPKFVSDETWPGVSMKLLSQFHQNLATNYQQTLQQFLLLQFQNTQQDRVLLRELKQQLLEQPQPSVKNLLDTLNVLEKTDLRPELNTINCRQLYLFGRRDVLVPPAVADQIKLLNPNASVEILEKVSHAPFLSEPILCTKKITHFLT